MHTDDVVGEVKHAARRLRRAVLLQRGRKARPMAKNTSGSGAINRTRRTSTGGKSPSNDPSLACSHRSMFELYFSSASAC